MQMIIFSKINRITNYFREILVSILHICITYIIQIPSIFIILDIDSPNKPDTLEKKYIGISDVKGDLIGTDVHGSGNFIGKEIHYTVRKCFSYY